MQLRHDGVKFGAYCGLLLAQAQAIEILPKIYRRQEASNRGVLVKMLATCLDTRLLDSGLVQAGRAEDLLSIFIERFLDEVCHQARQGVIRTYRQTQAQLAQPRGRLLVTEQMRRGPAGLTRLSCAFEHLSPDQPLNQVLKAALGCIDRYFGHRRDWRARLSYLHSVWSDVQAKRMTAQQASTIRLNRLSQRYRLALDWAVWILQLLGPDVVGGIGSQGVALLFNMNRLFEQYVQLCLASELGKQGAGLYCSAQGQAQHLLQDEAGQPHVAMRPDILLTQAGRVRLIADAKWKWLNSAHEVSQADIYQMLAYAQAYGVSTVYLLYPQPDGANGSPLQQDFFFQGGAGTITLCVRTVDIESISRSLQTLIRDMQSRL